MKKTIQYLLLFLVVAPFYAQVQPYYNGLDLTKKGNNLFLELATRIKDTHNPIPYGWDALKEADEDPDISTNVLLIYGYDDNDGSFLSDRTRDKNFQDTGSGASGVWNREHVFAKSLANPSLETGSPGPGTDIQNLRPADRDWNSERSSRKYTDGSGNSGIVTSNGGWYPGDEWKGDVARIIMYMYLRYHGTGTQISETSCLPINVGFGDPLVIDNNMIDLFLRWNYEDQVSTFEVNKNQVLESYQGNRNPFIDNPYLATLIWGGLNAQDLWWSGTSNDTEAPTIPLNLTESNVTDESFDVSWDASTDNEAVGYYLVYVDGVYLKSVSAPSTSATIINLDSNTTFAITIKAQDAAGNASNASAALNVTTLTGPKILFEEYFEDCANINFVAYNEASNKNWACNDGMFGENNSGSYGINGYGEDVASKDWLITTNPINFDTDAGEKLSFYSDATYGIDPLELVYSSDYDGSSNPSEFNWEAVPNVPSLIHDDSPTEKTYIITDADISTITGTVYFAFKYYSYGKPTRWTVDSFEITADNDNPDRDGDGVLNEDDLCSNTPSGETVDLNGCSIGQLDDDNDGVQNSDDLCTSTPSGEPVNATGCSESQIDDDGDGVMNNVDICSNTLSGETVDLNGCSNGQLDDDNDGVQNSDDLCASTPSGEQVNATGCSESQIDDDGDGIMNNVDTCSDTPIGEIVDNKGCSASQLDDDNDGVMNDKDQCENTPIGTNVNAAGCFTLASDNFKIETVGETCPTKANGKLVITALETNSYKATINGTLYTFTDILTVEKLAPATYDFCILVEGQTYQQCYTTTIEAGKTIGGKASVTSNKVIIDITEGTAPFNILVNGTAIFQTMNSSFSVDAWQGDLIQVKTSIDCEGVFAKEIDLFESITAYPNPTKGIFEIGLPFAKKEVIIELYNMQSQLISSKTYAVNYGKAQLNIEELPRGLYLVKVKLNKPVTIKIVKH